MNKGKLILLAAIGVSILDGFAGGTIGSIPIIGIIWSGLGNSSLEVIQAVMIGVGISMIK